MTLLAPRIGRKDLRFQTEGTLEDDGPEGVDESVSFKVAIRDQVSAAAETYYHAWNEFHSQCHAFIRTTPVAGDFYEALKCHRESYPAWAAPFLRQAQSDNSWLASSAIAYAAYCRSLEPIEPCAFQYWLQVSEGSSSGWTFHQARPEIDQFLAKVYSLNDSGREEEAIDVVLGHFNDLLEAQRQDECDRILDRIELSRIPHVLMLSFLTITAGAKGKLKNREKFFHQVWQLIADKRGNEIANRLLNGLA